MNNDLQVALCRSITARAVGSADASPIDVNSEIQQLLDTAKELGQYVRVDSSSRTGLRWIKPFIPNGTLPGSEVGSRTSRGYYSFRFRGKRHYNHRTVLLLSGVFPPTGKHEVDHIDRNRANNCLSNLRWVTRSENHLNKGVYGAYPWRYVTKGRDGLHRAQYWDRKRRRAVWVGYFENPCEAHIAAIAHKLEHHWSIDNVD